MKYILPHPGSSHLYVRRCEISDDVVQSFSVETRLAAEDAVANDADCFVTDGGAGAMGHSRLVPWGNGGDAAVATTMIAAGVDDSGTNMPLTLVKTTGKGTGFDAAGCLPATVLTANVAECCNDALLDEQVEDESS